jgi:hypothetical protein
MGNANADRAGASRNWCVAPLQSGLVAVLVFALESNASPRAEAAGQNTALIHLAVFVGFRAPTPGEPNRGTGPRVEVLGSAAQVFNMDTQTLEDPSPTIKAQVPEKVSAEPTGARRACRAAEREGYRLCSTHTVRAFHDALETWSSCDAFVKAQAKASSHGEGTLIVGSEFKGCEVLGELTPPIERHGPRYASARTGCVSGTPIFQSKIRINTKKCLHDLHCTLELNLEQVKNVYGATVILRNPSWSLDVASVCEYRINTLRNSSGPAIPLSPAV